MIAVVMWMRVSIRLIVCETRGGFHVPSTEMTPVPIVKKTCLLAHSGRARLTRCLRDGKIAEIFRDSLTCEEFANAAGGRRVEEGMARALPASAVAGSAVTP